jgi:predicted kinase
MKNAILLRGLPGSGKTTLALLLNGEEGKKICSTDTFFMTPAGYVFDFAKLSENHKKCKDQFEQACKSGLETVILDNTNLKRKYLQPYIEIAKEHGYQVLEILVGNPKDSDHQFICAGRNTHGVTLDKVKEMGDGFEP